MLAFHLYSAKKLIMHLAWPIKKDKRRYDDIDRWNTELSVEAPLVFADLRS